MEEKAEMFIVSENDAVDLSHVAAIDTDEYGMHTIYLDTGFRIGVTEALFVKIMEAIRPEQEV